MNAFPPPVLNVPAPPQPKKSHRARNIGISVAVLFGIGLIGSIVSPAEDEADAKTAATTYQGAETTVAPETTAAPTTENQAAAEVADYVNEIIPLLTRATGVMDDISDVSTHAGSDIDGWIAGDYGDATIGQWTESKAIYDDWLDVAVPSGLDDLDDATGAVFESLVDTTDDFSDSAIAGNIDDATASLQLAIDGMDETTRLIAEAQAEVDELM